MAKNKNIEGDNAKENEGFRLLKEAFEKNEGIEIKKNDDRETQLKGIDFEFDIGGKHRICDEKFAADYISTSTFPHSVSNWLPNRPAELENIRRGGSSTRRR